MVEAGRILVGILVESWWILEMAGVARLGQGTGNRTKAIVAVKQYMTVTKVDGCDAW